MPRKIPAAVLLGLLLAAAFWCGLHASAHAASRKPIVIGASGQQQQLQSGDALWDGTNPFGLMSGTVTSGDCLKSGGGALIADVGGMCATLSGGLLPCSEMPALTGDVTNTAGSCVDAIAANAVTNAKAAQMGANTVKGNPTGATANPQDEPVTDCHGASSAVTYTAGTGWGCNAITGGGGAGPWVPLNLATTLAPNLLKFGPPTLLNTVNGAGYYDPQPAGLIDVTDGFTSVGNYTTHGTGSLTVSGGIGTMSVTGSNFFMIGLTSDTTLVAPQFFNAIEVTAQTPSTGYSNIYAGAFKDGANYVGCYYDAVGHAIHTEYNVASAIHNTSVKSGLTLTPPYVIGCSLSDNSLSAWYQVTVGGNWIYAGNVSTASVFDYTITANFASAGYKTGALISLGGTGNFHVSNLQGGRFGGIAIRDLKWVNYTDASHYWPGSNLLYFTASTFDFGGAGNQSIFTLNVNTMAITQTGTICATRTVSAVSHTYCGDDAGKILVHVTGEPAGGSTGDRTVMLDTWSNNNNTFPVQLEYQYLSGGPDILNTNLTVLSPTQLTMPFGSSGAIGAYDGDLVYSPTNARWEMTYTGCVDCTFASTSTQNFFPFLAHTTGAPTGTWTSDAVDTAVQGGWEGNNWYNQGGNLYIQVGGPSRSLSTSVQQCTTARVYSETLTYLGTLLGATFNPIPGGTAQTSCGHPALFQMPDGDHVGLLTFTGAVSGATTGQAVIEISTP